MGRTASGLVKPKRPVAMWPANPLELCRGVNDTWNSYQRANKGRTVTTAEWKTARSSLWTEHEKMLSSVESSPLSSSDSDGFFDSGEEPQAYSPGMKRDFQSRHEASSPPDLFADAFDDADLFAKRPRVPGDSSDGELRGGGSGWADGDYVCSAFDEWSTLDNLVIFAPEDSFC
jgi:hypothetical protein